MSLTGGPLPRNNQIYSCTTRSVVLFLYCLLFAALASAQQGIPLTLAAAEDLAMEQEPGRNALLAQARAYEEASIAAGQLPDPKLRVGLANFPLQHGGFTTEGMTQAQLGLRMEVPRRGKLEASTRQYESLAVEMRETADGRSRDVLTSVRNAWLDTYYWQRTHQIVDEARPFFVDLVTVARSL